MDWLMLSATVALSVAGVATAYVKWAAARKMVASVLRHVPRDTAVIDIHGTRNDIEITIRTRPARMSGDRLAKG